MPDFDFMNRMNDRAVNSFVDPSDYISRLTQERNNIVRSSFLKIKDEPKKYTNMLLEYNKAKFVVDNAKNIYLNPDSDPREQASIDNFATMMTHIYPQLSKDMARSAYKPLIKSLYGDDMSATNVMEVVGSKIGQGFSQSWLGLKTYLFSIGQNFSAQNDDIKKQKIDDYKKAINTAMSQYKRTDYYNKDFDSFLEQAVLSAADFIPSEVFSLAPSLIGMALTAVSGVPMFYSAGKAASVAMAGFMEAGSSAMEMMRAGADVDTIAAFSTVVGLINGILEQVGNIPEEKVASRLFEVQKLKKQIGRITGDEMSAMVSDVMKKWGVDYAMGFLTEPSTEMVQELVSMLGTNMASKWEEKFKGRAFSDEFTYSIDEMIDAMKEVGLSTLKGQTIMGLTTVAGNAINDMKKGGSFLGMQTETGELRRILETRKYAEYGAESKLVGSENVVTDSSTKAFEPAKTEDSKGKKTAEKVKDINVVNINGKLYPVDPDSMAKAKYMKKANGKYGMYVNVVTDNKAQEKQSASKDEASHAVEHFGKLNTPYFVTEDGEIQVNPKDFNSAVVAVINSLGKNYSGILDESSDGVNKVVVYGNDRAYTISDNVSVDSQPVTVDSTYARMAGMKGDSLSYIKRDFRSNLDKMFTRRGITGEEHDKAVNDFAELAENLMPTAQNLVEQIKKKRDVEDELAEQTAYGIAGMAAEFKTIADIDSEWAKNHIVLDDKLISDTTKKGKKVGGNSVWSVNGRTYKNFLDIPSEQRKDAVFHISVSSLVNQTTGIHEVGHMALSLGEEKFLADDWFRNAFYEELKADNTGVDDERQWKIGDNTHEAFASKLETYIDTGVAENKEEASLFRRILGAVKAFFDKIYNSLTDDQLEFYDRLFGNGLEESESSESMSQESDEESDVSDEDNERYQTSMELDERYAGWNDNHTDSTGKDKTQIAGTRKTYQKLGEFLKKTDGWENLTILDASSGLGYGTQDLRAMGFNVDDVEPYPSDSRMANENGLVAPTYTNYSDIDKKYDVVISNAVLNVIPDDWRDNVLKAMSMYVKDGGRIFINVRGAKEIEKQGVEGKTRITLDSPSEILVTDFKKGEQQYRAYQKGFTPDELKAYVERTLGDGFTVEKANKNNVGDMGGTTVVVTKLQDNNVGEAFKNANGNRIGRSKYGVGKQVGNQIYVHKDYATDIVDNDILNKAEELLPESFDYNAVMYDTKNPNVVRFDEAPDFDTAREPHVGDMYTVNVETGEVKKSHSDSIWHHKWEWVKNGYSGFDVAESYNWSKTWASVVKDDLNKIGTDSKWQNVLDGYGLGNSRNQTISDDAQRQYDEVVAKYKDTDQWLKAPNGNDSNLDERLWVTVRTENFKKWFGDWINDPQNASKVVDENGEPLIVYHGTEDVFDVFNPNIIKNGKELGYGSYFTKDRLQASVYGDAGAYFLNIRNPFSSDKIDFETKEFSNVDEAQQLFDEKVKEYNDKAGGYNRFFPIADEKNGIYSVSYATSYKNDADETNDGKIAGNVYVVYSPNQIKSATDNNGDFSMEDDRFRYQQIDRSDLQEYELEYVNQVLEQGKMIPSFQLTRYKDKSDWARAEQRAETIYTDGELVWMSKLLETIVQEVKGELVMFDEISDSDWELIEKAFIKRGDEKVGSMYRTRRDKMYTAYRTDDKVAEKTTDFFNGNDVDKVLKRLYVNNLYYDNENLKTAWLNKFTGRDATAGPRNVKWLAMKLKDLGIFDRDKADFDGISASKRFRFLDTLLQTMYTGEHDRHYDETRASAAIWLGAQKEILANADYLLDIDQNYTPRKGGGVQAKGVEDKGVSQKYQSFAEKDIRKSYEDKIKAENELAQKQEELANAIAYADDIRAERDDTVAELKKVAEKYNINTEGMYRIEHVADAIRKADEKVAKENEKLLKKADDIKAKLDESRDNIRELRSDIRIKDRSIRDLEVQNRKQARDIQRLSSDVKELLKTKDFDNVFYNAEKNKVKQLEEELDDTITRLDSLRKEDNELKKNYDSAIDDLRDARKKLLDAEKTAKENTKLKKQSDLDNEVISILDNNLAMLMNELRATIKKKEKYARALWIRNEQIEDLKATRLIENSKRNWKEMLEAKSGDATMDKALRMFSRVFFQRTATSMVNKKNMTPFKALDIDANPDLKKALSNDGVLYNSKGIARHVPSLYSVLENEGFIVNGKLVKGFAELQLGKYSEIADAIRVARNESNSISSQREEARKKVVNKVASDSKKNMSGIGLSREERKEAHKRFINGEFSTEQKAQEAVWKERKPYLHEGTQAQKKRKKKLTYGKKFNPNNNIGFNSFTSGYNLLGDISPELQDLFFFGSDEIKGINEITDTFLKMVEMRQGIVNKEINEYFNGDKKALKKFMKEAQKKVVTKQMDVDKAGAPYWLKQSQTWNNFKNTQKYNDNFSDYSLTLEEVIGIYEHSKQDEDLAHILQERTNITARQVAWIVDQFEREDGVFHEYKAIADAYQHAYEVAWDRFQKVANDIYGMALTHYDFYSPARTAEDESDLTLYYDFDANGMPKNYGKKMTMAERADMQIKTGGNNPINLSYVTGFNSIIRSQEWFINAAEFFKNWNDIMKNDGGGVRRTIEDRMGSNIATTTMKWMKSIADSEFNDVASGINKYMDTIRNHMALANLGFSISSTAQQPSVMFLAASKYGYRRMFKALSSMKDHDGIRGFVSYVHENSPQIKATADINVAYAKQAISDSRFLKSVGLAQDIAEFGMKGIERVDQFCRCLTWEMGYQYYTDKGMSKEEAMMRATQDTMNMNSSRQAKDNSLVYNSKNPLWKSLLLFTNQLNKQWNMLIGEDGVKALFNGQIKQFVSTVLGLGLASTWVLLAKGKFLNSGDDKEWWEDLWVDYLGEGIAVVPVIGDKISSAINGYSYLNSDLVTSMTTFLKTAMSEDKNGKKGAKVTTAAKNMTTDFLELIGAPKVLFKNTYNALFENGKWIGDEYFTSSRYLRQLLPYEWYQYVTKD